MSNISRATSYNVKNLVCTYIRYKKVKQEMIKT